MYIDNGKISSRQTFRLFVFDLMGIATLLLPPYLAKLCGVDGVWAIVLGAGAGLLYLFYLGFIMKQMKTDMKTYLHQEIHGVIRLIVLTAIFLHSVFTAGFCSFLFASLMQYSLVQQSSFGVILFIIVLVAAYAVGGGIESRARVYEVLFFLVLVPYLAMMFASIKDFEPVYIEGLFSFGTESLLKGVYLVFLFFTPLFFVLFLIGEKEKNYGRNIIKTVSASILLAGTILAGSYFLLVGNFGAEALGTMRYPVVTLMSTIQFKGNFLKRMDALMVAVWFFTLYALLNLHLHYGANMLNEIFHKEGQAGKKDKKGIMIVIAATVVFLVGLYLGQYPKQVWLFVDYYSYVAVPFMLIIPGLLLLLRKREVRMSENNVEKD